MQAVIVITAFLIATCVADSYRDKNRDYQRDRIGYYRDHDQDDDDQDYDRVYCKTGWVANALGNKCYFYSTTFQTFSHMETVAFCDQLGGRVVEPRTQAEYDDALTFVRKYGQWTDGPLLNYFAPANDDSTVVLGSTFQPPSDHQLLSTLQGVAKLSTNGKPLENQCFTFLPNLEVQFAPCNSSNNPFCEISKEDE